MAFGWHAKLVLVHVVLACLLLVCFVWSDSWRFLRAGSSRVPERRLIYDYENIYENQWEYGLVTVEYLRHVCESHFCIWTSDTEVIIIEWWKVVVFLMAWSGSVITQLIFAIMYKKQVVDQIPRLPQMQFTGAGEYHQGPFDCCNHAGICCHAFFCTYCRVAHSIHVTQSVDYWPALLGIV